MLRSDRFDLPTGERTFPGAGAEAINNNCLACHSAGMVLTQPPLTRAAWQGEVEKMRSQFKAPVAGGRPAGDRRLPDRPQGQAVGFRG